MITTWHGYFCEKQCFRFGFDLTGTANAIGKTTPICNLSHDTLHRLLLSLLMQLEGSDWETLEASPETTSHPIDRQALPVFCCPKESHSDCTVLEQRVFIYV